MLLARCDCVQTLRTMHCWWCKRSGTVVYYDGDADGSTKETLLDGDERGAKHRTRRWLQTNLATRTGNRCTLSQSVANHCVALG